MVVPSVWRWLFAIVAVAVLCACGPPVGADEVDLDREIAAVALVKEAEKLIQLALPEEALGVLYRLQVEHPESEQAAWADFHRAKCLMLLLKHDEAIATARATVDKYPGTLLSAWAQVIVGEVLVRQEEYREGVRELLKVSDMVADDSDTGPIDVARGVLGRVFTADLAYEVEADPLQTIAKLDLEITDQGLRAQIIAITAVFRMKQDRLDLANALLDRLTKEYPSQIAEIEWAFAEVSKLVLLRDDNYSVEAAQTLLNLYGERIAPSQRTANTYLALARYSKRLGHHEWTSNLLEHVLGLGLLGTEADPAVLYELGNALNCQGRHHEANAVYQQIVDSHPLSGYVAAALYMIGNNSRTDRDAAIKSLAKLAEGKYDDNWRALAYDRLGNIVVVSDKRLAQEYYRQAIQVYQKRLSEGIAERDPDWRQVVSDSIQSLEDEIRRLSKEQGGAR